jgi:BolA protein
MEEKHNQSLDSLTSIESEIKKRLADNLSLIHFELKDFTGRHLNHKTHEGGFHLEAVIVSDDFSGLSLINRHKKVYEAMGDLMKHEIHALSMKTLTKQDWENV